MGNKIYYDDPLIAAYMAREFGLTVQDELERVLDYQELLIFAELSIDAGKCYIAPKSLDMFKPQVGDLVRKVFNEGQGDSYQILHNAKQVKLLINSELDFEIIQRDGKQFFMPKSEVVEDEK